MTIDRAKISDSEAILNLQHICYQSEAQITGDPDIAPLKQDISGMRADIEKMTVLAMSEENKIIGSIRA